jgi:hypothetical protein
MDPRSRGGRDDEVRLDSRDAGSVARYIGRERQKRDLRRERDVLLLALARDLGERAFAERMDLTEAAIEKLVKCARDRLGAGASAEELMIRARRLRSDPQRWADADAHFAALGGARQISVRRGAPPPA